MSDSKDTNLVQLKPADYKVFSASIDPMLLPGETVLSTYRFMRFNNGAVFTNKRIITIVSQGTSQTIFTFLHYSKIQAYSATHLNGIIHMHTLNIWCQGLGDVELGFASKADVLEACKIISMNMS